MCSYKYKPCIMATLVEQGRDSIYLNQRGGLWSHYSDVIMSAIESQITSVSIVCITVCPGTDQRKHQISAPLAFVRGIHRWPVNSPHKGPVTRKTFPFDDVIMVCKIGCDTSMNQCTKLSSIMNRLHSKCRPVCRFNGVILFNYILLNRIPTFIEMYGPIVSKMIYFNNGFRPITR